MLEEEVAERLKNICKKSGLPEIDPDRNPKVATLVKKDGGLFFKENNSLYAREGLLSANYCRLGIIDDLEMIMSDKDLDVSFGFAFPTYAVRVIYSVDGMDAHFSVYDGKYKRWVFRQASMRKKDEIQAIIDILETRFGIYYPGLGLK